MLCSEVEKIGSPPVCVECEGQWLNLFLLVRNLQATPISPLLTMPFNFFENVHYRLLNYERIHFVCVMSIFYFKYSCHK